MAIKDYEIVKQIGSGGMGAVFLARDPRLDRLVAIKKIRVPVNIERDLHHEVVQRFYREARAIANLNHPNIVTIYELGEDTDTKECFMVMEYLQGKSLEQLLQEQKFLPVNLVLKIGIQVCESLSYMHQKQIIHRDIKPGNLIYCDSGMLKLTDFGLVRIDDKLDLTRAGTLLGSVLYMSPEQIENPKNVDTRVDMYAFGVTMYQALSGEFPYNGDTVWDVITKITTGEPKPLTVANPIIQKTLEKIIMKSISKKKENRFADMMELQDALVNYNMLNVQTIISPLGYVKTAQKSYMEQARQAIMENIEHKPEEKIPESTGKISQVPQTTSDPGLLRTEHHFPINGVSSSSPDFSKTELLYKDTIPPVLPGNPNGKSILDFINEDQEQEKDFEIQTFDYPENAKFEEMDSQSKHKFVSRLRKLHEKLSKEEEINSDNCDILSRIVESITNEINDLYNETKDMINQYNSNISSPGIIYDFKDSKRKIELKKLQRTSKEKELNFLKEKFEIYEKLHQAKKLRKEITGFIIDEILASTSPGFFDSSNSVFKLSERQAENVKEIILERLNRTIELNDYLNQAKGQLATLKKISSDVSQTQQGSPVGSVIRFLPRNNCIEVKLFDDLEGNSLLEIDMDSSEILFTYCSIIFNNKTVPKVQHGNIVLLRSDSFSDDVRKKIKTNNQIFKGKQRLFRKSLHDDELKAYGKLFPILENLSKTVENNINEGFNIFNNMFTQPDPSDLSLSPETKQMAVVKTNKIRKGLLDLKKDFETANTNLKEYSKYISNIIPSLTKFPTILKNYENEIKSKKEQRKRMIQSLLMQISKSNPDSLKEQSNSLLNSINSFKGSDIPQSLLELMSFYLLHKARLPTGVTKNEILDNLNKERDKLTTGEIDMVCRLLNLKYSRERGFILKVGL